MKYGEISLGQVEAAINKLGGLDVWNAWLRGEKTVIVQDAIKVLFDKNGRRIPDGLSANVCDADRNFWLNQPKLETEDDYANRITRLHTSLGINTGITVIQLREETERLLGLIRDNSQIANIVKGVWLPVVLPQLTSDDLGTALEQYLEGVSRSYVETFNDRTFYNYREGTLAGEVGIVDGSRHDQLIERMKQGPVIGLHFPNPLRGFSIYAQREQMSTLPEEFILSGLDTVIAMMMYLDVLARDWHTPGSDLAAVSWQAADDSLCFGAGDDLLSFGGRVYLAFARGCSSGGLLFLG